MADLALAEQFPRLERQREADRLGLLIFLSSEIMLFGGIFAAFLVLRIQHPHEYLASSKEMHIWFGSVNTAVLLTSSMLVAIAVETTRMGQAKLTAWLLGGAIALGLAFLAIKGTEYYLEYTGGMVPVLNAWKLKSGPETVFSDLYFTATGLHAIHVTIGLALLGSMIWPFGRERLDRGATVVGNAALYWHLVDVIWIFLYPTIYLAR